MSVLETPRVYFRGQMTWDPIVTNNYQQFYDSAAAKPVLGDGTVGDYRERARQAIARGNWNPHGTHRSQFFDTRVSGVDRGGGLEMDDALVNVPVSFAGMLVDLDPYGATTSQLFFDNLSCGIQGPQILARSGAPLVGRRLNFSRNLSYRVIAGRASVIWQASFPWEGGLSLEPHGSAVLEDLRDALADDETLGLTVRMNTYRTIYYNRRAPGPPEQADLAERIRLGGFHPNPARSLLVGVIGLWRRDEPSSVPADRVLVRMPECPVSTAFARVDQHRLTIDLGNSVPETGFDLEKLDLGPLRVSARTASGEIELGTLEYGAYNREAYEATSGLAVLPLDPEAAAAALDGDIEVAADDTSVLQEQPLTVCAEPPAVYLEEGEGATVELLAFERGRRPAFPVSISAVEAGGSPLPVERPTDPEGRVTVRLSGTTAGTWSWTLIAWRAPTTPVPGTLPPDVGDYLTLRVTPADDRIAQMEPTWANVYEYVLRDWEAVAPCMDNWLPFSDEAECRASARLIRSLTSRDKFNGFRYMPVTRDLSRGQRVLLHRWCDQVTSAPAAVDRAIRVPEAAPEPDPFSGGL